MLAYQPITGGSIRVAAVAWDDDGASTTSVATFTVRECPAGQSCATDLTADDRECCIEFPVIHWVAPKPGQRHVGPATITLEVTASIAQVTASIASDTISAVEFFANERLLGRVAKPPFRYTWSGIQPGTYYVTARARTELGLVGESDVHTIRVTTH